MLGLTQVLTTLLFTLMVPSAAVAPDVFFVKLETDIPGSIYLRCTRAWAPNGADHFYDLVNDHFYDDVAFFRVVPHFVVQFGIGGAPLLLRLIVE